MIDWKLRDEEFKGILHRNNDPDDETTSVTNTIKELVPHLKVNPCWRTLPRQSLTAIVAATTFHSLNRALDNVYDFADDNKIWLGFMPSD